MAWDIWIYLSILSSTVATSAALHKAKEKCKMFKKSLPLTISNYPTKSGDQYKTFIEKWHNINSIWPEKDFSEKTAKEFLNTFGCFLDSCAVIRSLRIVSKKKKRYVDRFFRACFCCRSLGRAQDSTAHKARRHGVCGAAAFPGLALLSAWPSYAQYIVAIVAEQYLVVVGWRRGKGKRERP